jgi:hypothetical protein
MKVLISTQSASDPLYVQKLNSLAKGISACGDTVIYDEGSADVAVLYGSIKSNRGRSEHLIKKSIIKKFKKYVQLETPLVGRTLDPDSQYFRVGINGFLWDTANWGFDHMSQHRMDVFFKEFDYPNKTKWNSSGNHILVCMQKWGDASLGTVDTYQWCEEVVKQLRKITDRKILIRPHPLYRKKLKIEKLKQQMVKIKNVAWRDNDNRNPAQRVPIREDLNDCWCTVTYTSGSAVDSVLHGVPNIALGTGNMAWPVSSHSLSDIEKPHREDKTDWLNKIAHCQWSLKEFESGECWQHIRKSL